MSKRILSLVLALVMVLGTFGTVFAADAVVTAEKTVEQKAGEFLQEAKVLLGDGEGELNLDLKLERRDMVVLLSRLMGEEEIALEFPVSEDSPTWEDVRTDAYYLPMLAWGQVNKYFAGKSETVFAPREAITAQDYAVVLLRALGYDMDGHDAWTTALAEAKALGILADVEVENTTEITRGQMSVMTLNALAVNVKDSTKTLAETLEIVLPVVVPTELEVVSVSANNLKTMVVEFNKAVDEDTITATTVKVTKGTTNVVDARLLSEDGMTLTIVYASSAVPQSTELKLAIDGVKSVDGTETIEEYTNTMMVNDVMIPEVLGVTALNAKQLEVFFSEPVNLTASAAYSVLSQFKVNDVSVIATVAHNYRANSVILELSSVLEAKTHTLEVKDITDFATYKAVTKSLEFVVVEDKAAPVMINAEFKSVNRIEVTFDETVATVGNFWVNGQVATPSPVANSNGRKFELTGFTALDLGAIVQIKVEYQNQKDVVGNTVSTKTDYTFTVQDDVTLPTVTVEVKTGNKLVLTFSKPMLQGTGTIQILKSNESVHSALYNVSTFKTGSNDTVLELAASTVALNGINAGKYFVNIKGMKDATVRANLLPEQKIEINTLDTLQPSVVGGYTVAAGTLTGVDAGKDDTITFYFSEAMDVETLKNLSNYVNEDLNVAFSAIPGVAYKSASADGKSVTFTYLNASSLTTTEFTIYALKDVAGNMLVTKNNYTKLGTGFDVDTTAVATAGDKVVLTFDTPMFSVDPSFIKVVKGADDYAVPVSATIGGTGSLAGRVVTFTLNKSIGTATEGYTVVILNKTLAKDIYGQGYVAADTPATIATFTDEISPTLVSITQKTDGGSPAVAIPNTFIIKFSEKVTVGTLENLKNDLIIKYADGTPAANNAYTLSNIVGTPSDSIEVTLAPNAKLVNGSNAISVQLFAARELRDTNLAGALIGNYAKVFDATTVNVTADAVAPTMVSAAVKTANTVITVTFNENVTGTFASNDGGFVVASTTTPGTTYAVTAWAQGATANTIDLTVDDFSASMGSGNGGVRVTYTTAGSNDSLQDLVGNLAVTNASGVVIAE